MVRSYKGNIAAVAKHLRWPEAKVRAAVHYAEAYPREIDQGTAEKDSADFKTLKRMLPQTVDFVSPKRKRGLRAQTASGGTQFSRRGERPAAAESVANR